MSEPQLLEPSRHPSRAFGYAALLGLVAMLPGVGYVWLHALDTIRHWDAGSSASDLLLILGVGVVFPLPVAWSALRMMRRRDRPVGIFVTTLVLTSVPTLLLAGLATFGPDELGLVVVCLLGLVSGAFAATTAIVASIRARRAR